MKYIIEQEDPSYYLKYRDLCLKQETFACLCNEGEQEINMDNFIKWWFSDYLSLYNIISCLFYKNNKFIHPFLHHYLNLIHL